MTVGELLSRADSHELMEWGVLMKIEASEQAQARGGNQTQF
jgi:hypothetical protein